MGLMSRVGPLNPRGHDRVTVVMVTHNLAAAKYGDRTLEMQDGRIVREVRAPAASPGDVEPRN